MQIKRRVHAGLKLSAILTKCTHIMLASTGQCVLSLLFSHFSLILCPEFVLVNVCAVLKKLTPQSLSHCMAL